MSYNNTPSMPLSNAHLEGFVFIFYLYSMKTHTLYTLIIVALALLLMHQCNRSDQASERFKQEQQRFKQHLNELTTEYLILEQTTDSLHRIASTQKHKLDSIRNQPPEIVIRWKEREQEIADLSPSEAFKAKDSVSVVLGLRTPQTDSLMTALEAKHFVWLHEKVEVQDSVIQWQGLVISELDKNLGLQYELVGQYQGKVGNLLAQNITLNLSVESHEREHRRKDRNKKIDNFVVKPLLFAGGVALGVGLK